MRRTWLVYAVLTLLLGLLALGVGFTRFPQAGLFVRAEGLPWVGEDIARLRRLYLPPEERASESPVAESTESGGEPTTTQNAGTGGGSRPIRLPGTSLTPPERSSVWLSPGEVLRSRPDGAAGAVGEVDAFTEAPILDRRSRWLKVRLAGREGWVLPPQRQPGEPPLGSDPAPALPLPSRAPDPQRLAEALRAFGGEVRKVQLGPYPAHTDITDPGLLTFLGNVAAAVEPAYRNRYRQPPVGDAREAVVLFAREDDYRALQESEQRLRRLPSSGHAGYGLVALWSGGRPRDEIGATLVHELVHMLNRRAIGPALPPWLGEGLADDLASSGIDPSGGLDPSRLGGSVLRGGDRVTYSGARAAARQLMEAHDADDLPSLRRLVYLDWDGFVRSERREHHYPLAAFWVRYLLVGESGGMAGDFRQFLALVAAGRPATGDTLIDTLGRSWDSLEWGFWRWMAELAAREADYDATGVGSPRR